MVWSIVDIGSTTTMSIESRTALPMPKRAFASNIIYAIQQYEDIEFYRSIMKQKVLWNKKQQHISKYQ